MEFYKNIANYYDFIFPYNSLQKDFVLSFFDSEILKEIKLLDIGCATGKLLYNLSSDLDELYGIDLNSDLVEIAKNKCKTKNNINIFEMDMLDIGEKFQDKYPRYKCPRYKYLGYKYFDIVTSFGNTIPHLNGEKQIEKLFNKVNSLLKSNGLFLFQIINYDRILKYNIKHLSTIDNEKVIFERNYKLINEKIEFSTILTIKGKIDKLYNKVELFPLKQDLISKLLLKSGFKEIEFYGNLYRDKLDINKHIPIIVKAKK